MDHRPPLADPALGLTCHRALGPAEADLAKIQVGMVGADVMEDAGDRAPDTIVEALGRVGMHAAANILALRMANGIVRSECAADGVSLCAALERRPIPDG